MLYITNDESVTGIKDIDLYFTCVNIDNIDRNIISDVLLNVDNAILLENNIVMTKFGETLISRTSTGCKTVLTLIACSADKKYVPIVCCGDNAISEIFKLSKTIDMYAFINHAILPNYNDAECVINGKHVVGEANVYFELGDITNELY
ncbi:MAG: DUF4869 domain-containing protein [Lachnospiraceae bacterium]|nr:DUF4869 domain-containing protein [Lachnospiraceae bacterium]